MIVTELELTNIRSYDHTIISVPLGKTLFEGDIGSGKSTILMAMEFALFGLGSETGASLLRLGVEKGGVRMRFEVDGKEFEVSRGLVRKGGGVQQTEGHLVTPDEELDLSPKEMKERVLQMLEFNEAPDPKAQSFIFRYAVYTPQEEMKAVLSMSPDLRLQTLRRAFRVEDYKTAAENAAEIGRQLRGDIRELEGFGTGLDRMRRKVQELEADEEKLGGQLASLRKEEAEAESALAELKELRRQLAGDQLSKEGLRTERAMQEQQVREEERKAAAAARDVEAIGERERKILGLLEKLKGGRAPSRMTLAQLKVLEKEGGQEVRRLTALKATLESKLDDYATIMTKGVCPVCDRPVEAHEFAGRKASKDDELRHVAGELGRAEDALEATRSLREKTEEYLTDRAAAKEKRSELLRVRAEKRDKESELKAAERRRAEISGRLEELAKWIGELDALAERLAHTEKRVAQAERTLRDLGSRVAGTAEKVDQADKRKAELAIEIVAKEGAGARRDALNDVEIWLTSYFIPTVEIIERSVLATINQEFDQLFQRWFGMLAGDVEKEVRADEDFTPLVTQGGYEQEVRYLSGGERTSVALAYRLALNSLVQRLSVGMKSNLLVLDEPTDGFSKEQLGNVRDVLDEVGSPQVIIVSHDKELESFADQIFRVEKVRGRSTVRLAGA